jgi:hypothetical protein
VSGVVVSHSPLYLFHHRVVTVALVVITWPCVAVLLGIVVCVQRCSFRSAMCIRYAPVELALCSIYVGSKFCRVALPDGWMASASTLQRVTLKRCEGASRSS